MTKLYVGGPLRDIVGGNQCLEVAGYTLIDVLKSVDDAYPGFLEVVSDGRALRRYLNTYVDGTNSRSLGGLAAPVSAESIIEITFAVSGG